MKRVVPAMNASPSAERRADSRFRQLLLASHPSAWPRRFLLLAVLTLRLAFDLAGALRAYHSASCDPDAGLVDSGPIGYAEGATPTSCNVITVPQLSFAPIVERTGDSAFRETYTAHIASVGYDPTGRASSTTCTVDGLSLPSCRQNFDLRVVIYSLANDATHRAQSATVRAMVSDDATTPTAANTQPIVLPAVPFVSAMTVYGNGAFDLLSEQGAHFVSDLVRPAPLSAGAKLTAKLGCGFNALSFAGCGAIDHTAAPPALFESDVANPTSMAVSFTLDAAGALP